MPKARVIEESEYPLPKETPLPARLDKVTENERTFQYKPHHAAVKNGKAKVGETGSFVKWSWEFKVTDGDYAGYVAYGDTDAKVTNRADDKVRQWAETLLGRELGVGEELDTDLLVGLPCTVTVRHEDPVPRRDGSGNFYPCPVDEVFPADGAADFVPF